MLLVAQGWALLQVCKEVFACWVAAPVLLCCVQHIGGAVAAIVHPEMLLHCPALPRLIIALASALSICPAAWSMLKVLPTCAGVSTSAPAASSESGFAEAMRVVGLHLEEMNRRQAAQELAASHRDATIIETILQLKQQMGGRLTRSDPHSSTEVNAPTSSRGSGAPMDDNSPMACC